LAGTDIWTENGYSAVAPGSPLISAALSVETLLALYEDGREITSAPVPRENVSFLEFDVPDRVTVWPFFAAETLDAIVTCSGFPACVTEIGMSSTPDAFAVAFVCRAERPVCGVAVPKLAVPLPEPPEGFTVNQLAFAIFLLF
jgi:hypothetical protein